MPYQWLSYLSQQSALPQVLCRHENFVMLRQQDLLKLESHEILQGSVRAFKVLPDMQVHKISALQFSLRRVNTKGM
jgi:hypothetical protein